MTKKGGVEGKEEAYGNHARFMLLASIVGREAAKKICEALGGHYIYVPKLHEVAEREERNIRIYRDRIMKGESLDRVARRYRLSVPRIYQIVREVEDRYGDDLRDIDEVVPISDGG